LTEAVVNILVVGGGGREHAIVWKLARSPRAKKIYCAPGNGGIADIAECVGIKATDIGGLVSFARSSDIDLVFIGPDDPMALGLADACESAGLRVFGPRKAEARLEWSKSYAKGLMKKYGVPTADYRVCDGCEEALAALESMSGPFVIKADGLALGKGVTVTGDRGEAEAAIRTLSLDRIFGDSGSRVVLEECLSGPEMTVLAFTDGKTIKPMLSSQDHKRAFDGDLGPNTGGMGAFAPSPAYTEAVERECRDRIYAPTLRMLENERIRYHGVLYFGLMLTGDGVKVIEYNARFGDPETQAILPLMKNDLLDVVDAVIDERLDGVTLEWDDGYAACVIAASGGYPGAYGTGYDVGVQRDAGANTLIFHAGTRRDGGRLLTSGGRVLGVTGFGDSLPAAVGEAYRGIRGVTFNNMYYRKDIGKNT